MNPIHFQKPLPIGYGMVSQENSSLIANESSGISNFNRYPFTYPMDLDCQVDKIAGK